jgi:DNA-binding transcriptional LysR family regulator
MEQSAYMGATQADPLSGGELAAFVAAVDAASVNGAADALDLTQSAVTKRIQSLERRVGLRLLDRGRFGVRATAAGRALYPQARQALDALARAEEVVGELRERDRRVLTLAASHTIGEFLLPGWLAAFAVSRASAAGGSGSGGGVRSQVDIVNSPGVLSAVRERRAEIGFVEGLDDLDGVEAITVHHDEIVVVVDAAHRWARRRSLAPADLAREPYLTREAGSGTRGVADAALRGAGVELVPALEVASTQSVKRALHSGGFSLLSALAVEAEQRAGSLRAIPVRDVDLRRPLRAVRASRPPLTQPAAGFWAWLVALSARDASDG